MVVRGALLGVVGLFGPAVAALTLRKCGGWGWANSHFGKEVKGVTTTAVGRAPGRAVGFPKLPGLHIIVCLLLFFIVCTIISYFNLPPAETTTVGRGPGRGVGFPKLLLSKLPGSHMDAT